MKRALSLFSMMYLLFTVLSCDISYNEPVKEYLEYWSKAVTIGRYEVASETTVLDGRRNLSAVEPIKVELLLTNPKSYNIELENADGAYFDIYLNDDSSKTNIASSKTATLSSDKTVITLSADIPDKTERKNLMIDGFFIYYKESEAFEIPYSYSFKQLSAPDNPKNLKNPADPDTNGYHTLHFEMPNTSLNRNNDLTYRIDCYSSNTPGEYTFVATADVKADQAKKAGTKSNEFIYYFDEQEPSLQYDYVVTAISPEGVKSKTVSTSESLGLCYVTEPEIIFAGNGELNNLTAEKEGESKAYDVVEYTGDSFSINVVKTDSTSDLDVKVNGQTVDADTVLEDGFNTITATASKNRARPVSVTKNIYVTKKLVNPTITTNATQNGTTKVNGVTYDKMQYSYLTYDNCTYSIDNSANADSQITFKLDNTATTNLSGTLTDGTHSLEIIVEKEHCRPLTIKKNYSVGIRRVKAKINNPLHHWHSDGGADVDLTVELFIESSKTGKQPIWDCKDYHKKNTCDYEDNVKNDKVVYLYDKSDNFYFYTSKAIDVDKGIFNGGDDDLGTLKRGDSKGTRTLSKLKEKMNSQTFVTSFETGEIKGSDGSSKYWISLTLSEEVAEPLFEFTPARNGMSDNNGYECIEVPDSSSKVSYKISPQDGASISGSIDGVSFTGTKTGELAVGEHTISVRSTKQGYTSSFVTKYINVISSFSDPTIYFYANNTDNRIDTSTSNSPVPSYTTYDLTLTSSGTGNATMEITAESGTSVKVEDEGNELTAKNGRYELALGPHNLAIIVSKTGYASRVIAKNIYIQGALSEPDVVKVTSTDIESGSGNSQNDPRVIKYSYLDNDTLQCRVAPGNTGNTVVVHKGTIDGDVIDDATTSFDAGCESVMTLYIIQTRAHCKPLKTTKYVKGIIKPITLKYEVDSIGDDLQVDLSGFGADSFNARGEVSIWASTAQSYKPIWHYEGTNHGVSQGGWCTIRDTDAAYKSWSATFTSPSDTIVVRFTKFRRDRNNKSDIFFRNGDYDFPAISLSDIKKGKGENSTSGRNWTYICDKKNVGDQGARPKVKFSAALKK